VRDQSTLLNERKSWLSLPRFERSAVTPRFAFAPPAETRRDSLNASSGVTPSANASRLTIVAASRLRRRRPSCISQTLNEQYLWSGPNPWSETTKVVASGPAASTMRPTDSSTRRQ
jgi:hypothetical protein